jgi:hypothetical protein
MPIRPRESDRMIAGHRYVRRMERPPPARYARTPDGLSPAYQVFGSGPRDLLLVWGGVSHIELDAASTSLRWDAMTQRQ